MVSCRLSAVKRETKTETMKETETERVRQREKGEIRMAGEVFLQYC